ncbi:MAG: hypothetical protein SGPRY_010581 [Prymnesium sp.]
MAPSVTRQPRGSTTLQAAENIEERLLAIDSIPWYIDHSLNFFVLVPAIPHSDLPDVVCDYQSWKERGWCRLEEQVPPSHPHLHSPSHPHPHPLLTLTFPLFLSLFLTPSRCKSWDSRRLRTLSHTAGPS